MKFGNMYWLFQLVVGLLLVLGPNSLVIAEEQTCTADGDCSSEEAPKTEGGCTDGHDQCEFWGSVGESKNFLWGA